MCSLNKKYFLRVIVVFFISLVANSQWADYGGWTSLSLSQKVAKKTVASADIAMRWDRDFSRLGSTFIDASISREVLKDIKRQKEVKMLKEKQLNR